MKYTYLLCKVTQPLFNSLNMVCFHKLVIQRISLIMFKNEIGLVPELISQLFTRNSEYHNYNTRYSSSLHLSVGKVKRSFSFHGINIWNQWKMHVPTDVSYVCFNKLTLSDLIANDIVYKIQS